MKQLKNMCMIRCFKVFESVLYAEKSVTFCLGKIHLLFIVATDLNSMYSISNKKLTSGTCLFYQVIQAVTFFIPYLEDYPS